MTASNTAKFRITAERSGVTEVLKTQVQSGHPRYNRLTRLPCLVKDYKLKIFRGYPGAADRVRDRVPKAI